MLPESFGWWPGRQPNVADPREATPTGGQAMKSVPGRAWRGAGEAPWTGQGQQVIAVTKTGNWWPECFSAGCLLCRAPGSLALGAQHRAPHALGGHYISLFS